MSVGVLAGVVVGIAGCVGWTVDLCSGDGLVPLSEPQAVSNTSSRTNRGVVTRKAWRPREIATTILRGKFLASMVVAIPCDRHACLFAFVLKDKSECCTDVIRLLLLF